jgi:hypothetical protein
MVFCYFDRYYTTTPLLPLLKRTVLNHMTWNYVLKLVLCVADNSSCFTAHLDPFDCKIPILVWKTPERLLIRTENNLIWRIYEAVNSDWASSTLSVCPRGTTVLALDRFSRNLLCNFMVISCSFLRKRKVSGESCWENQNTFCVNAICEILWKNMVRPDGPWMKILMVQKRRDLRGG